MDNELLTRPPGPPETGAHVPRHLGLALAVIVSRSMSSLIYGVEPLDWISLTTSTCVLGTVAGIGALLPVWAPLGLIQ